MFRHRLVILLVACAPPCAALGVAADDAFVRAAAGILGSRGMGNRDRVDAADSLAR